MSNYIVILLKVVVRLIVFLSSANLICRSTDISKCFIESLGFRDNESRLYMYYMEIIIPFCCCLVVCYLFIFIHVMSQHNYPSIWKKCFYCCLFVCPKTAGWVANIVDLDSAASDLGLHCLFKLVYPNTHQVNGLARKNFSARERCLSIWKHCFPLQNGANSSRCIHINSP